MKQAKAPVKAAKSSKTGFYVALGAVAVVGIAALLFVSRGKSAAVKPLDPNLPAVEAQGHSIGNPNAPVEVLEFADFECPACAQFANITEPDIRAKLVQSGQVKVRFFDFPINEVHRNSVVASRAAACAEEQGKFWEMHDALFMNQDRWSTEASSNPREPIAQLAKQVGLDAGKFDECLDSGRHDAKIVANRKEADKHQVNSTPSFVIGGKLISGAIGYDEFKARVDSAMAAKPAAAPAAAPAGDTAKH